MYIITKENDATYGYAFSWTIVILVANLVTEIASWGAISESFDYETANVCEGSCGGEPADTMGTYGKLCQTGYIKVGNFCYIDTS